MKDKRFKKGTQDVNVSGLDLIFAVLCLIAKIMIYRLPVRDIIDRKRVDMFRKELRDLE